jgi:hypothetical protein
MNEYQGEMNIDYHIEVDEGRKSRNGATCDVQG